MTGREVSGGELEALRPQIEAAVEKWMPKLAVFRQTTPMTVLSEEGMHRLERRDYIGNLDINKVIRDLGAAVAQFPGAIYVPACVPRGVPHIAIDTEACALVFAVDHMPGSFEEWCIAFCFIKEAQI